MESTDSSSHGALSNINWRVVRTTNPDNGQLNADIASEESRHQRSISKHKIEEFRVRTHLRVEKLELNRSKSQCQRQLQLRENLKCLMTGQQPRNDHQGMDGFEETFSNVLSPKKNKTPQKIRTRKMIRHSPLRNDDEVA